MTHMAMEVCLIRTKSTKSTKSQLRQESMQRDGISNDGQRRSTQVNKSQQKSTRGKKGLEPADSEH